MNTTAHAAFVRALSGGMYAAARTGREGVGSEAQRTLTVVSLSKAIAEADSTWLLACSLLEYWIANGPSTSSRNGNDPSEYELWSKNEVALRGVFSAHVGGDGLISDELKEIVATFTADGGNIQAVHAAGWALSLACSATLPSTWRETLRGDIVTLSDGDLFPCCDAPWPWLADGRRKPTSRASSLTNPADTELPHVRRFVSPTIDGRETSLTVDLRFEAQLVSVLDRLELVAGVHPNEDIGDFDMPNAPSFFPIGAADTDRQSAAVIDGVERALAEAATIIVVPELAVDEQTIEQLAATIDDWEDDVLLVAGSRHHTDGGARVNDATGLLPDQRERLTHRKAVRFTTELGTAPGTREGIDRVEPVPLRMYQAGPYRLAVAVCKDLLDDSFVDALKHMGANVVLVPSMSPKTDAFAGQARALLNASQALTVMVCGPLRWGASGPDPIALRVQPATGAVQAERSKPSGSITRLPIG